MICARHYVTYRIFNKETKNDEEMAPNYHSSSFLPFCLHIWVDELIFLPEFFMAELRSESSKSIQVFA